MTSCGTTSTYRLWAMPSNDVSDWLKLPLLCSKILLHTGHFGPRRTTALLCSKKIQGTSVLAWMTSVQFDELKSLSYGFCYDFPWRSLSNQKRPIPSSPTDGLWGVPQWVWERQVLPPLDSPVNGGQDRVQCIYMYYVAQRKRSQITSGVKSIQHLKWFVINENQHGKSRAGVK